MTAPLRLEARKVIGKGVGRTLRRAGVPGGLYAIGIADFIDLNTVLGALPVSPTLLQ